MVEPVGFIVFEASGEPRGVLGLTYTRGNTTREIPWSPLLFFSVMGLDGVKRFYYRPEIYAHEQENRGGEMTAQQFMKRDNLKKFYQQSYDKLCELLGEKVEYDQFWQCIRAYGVHQQSSQHILQCKDFY